jgi:glycosyltransferase involved in cell wall biosynthesis
MSYIANGSKIILQNGDFTRDHSNSFEKASRNLRRPRNPRSTKKIPFDSSSFSIIVHCHLCWDWVWQRPQQFLSRLSHRHKILFVEMVAPDPQLASPFARFYTPESCPNVTVLRIQFPSWCWHDGSFVDGERRRLVKSFLEGPMAGEFQQPVQWFYDPMAVPAFAGQMNETVTVYDCMDELSNFRCAPPEIREREKELLELADVVFAGGRKLHAAKRLQNDNCHFYGCGVDAAHFGKAREPGIAVPADLRSLQKPVLGYFGVIDERMDYELIAKLADANPRWSIALVGPVLKVDAAVLPQRHNLHWLGQKAYADLPSYCKGFDVCLMPFAINEATEFINPTKSLEYMATGRPIVSSAVPDVVTNFGSVVKVANNHNEFISACKAACQQPDDQSIERGLRMVAENSWEHIVSKLEGHVVEALLKKQTSGVSHE